MISYLTGKIIELDSGELTILTGGGVGYSVGISDITYASLSINTETILYVYHHITEGNQSLFGFLDLEDKLVFKQLLKISGVGGKVALAILSLGAVRLANAIKNDDKKTIESIKGIGKKMAEKIILELKDKDFVLQVNGNNSSKFSNIITDKNIHEPVKSTLITMGYKSSDVDKALSELPDGLDKIQDIIPFVIKKLS